MHLKKSSLNKIQKERREELSTIKLSTGSQEVLSGQNSGKSLVLRHVKSPGLHVVVEELPTTGSFAVLLRQICGRRPSVPGTAASTVQGWVTTAAPALRQTNTSSKGRKKLKGLGRTSEKCCPRQQKMNRSQKYQCPFPPMTWMGSVMEPQRCPKDLLSLFPLLGGAGRERHIHSPS